jgi:hypothetical protein
LSDGHEVMRRPRAAPVSMTVQGPWQIEATGLLGVEECFRECNRLRLDSQRIRVDDAARQVQRVEIVRLWLPGGDFHDEDLFVGNAAVEALGG